MSKRKNISFGLYFVALTLSIVLVFSSVLILVLNSMKKSDQPEDNITNIILNQSDAFSNNSVTIKPTFSIDSPIFEEKQIKAIISSNQDCYLRVFVNFEFNFKGTNLTKRYDADIEETLYQITLNLPFATGQYRFTHFSDGYFYLTNSTGQPITLFELQNFYDSASEKYNFILLNFDDYVLNNTSQIFTSDTYQYYDYNLKVELQTLQKINFNENTSIFEELSNYYKENYIYHNEKVSLNYDNTLGYYINMGVYPYDFETASLSGRNIKWLALNYNQNGEQVITFFSEFILQTERFCENYNQQTSIYTNTLTGAYANDYYGSDVRASLISDEFLSKYNISKEDAVYKAIISQNILDIFENSVDYKNGNYVANTNIDTLQEFNPDFANESDKFVLLNYNEISLFNYASYGNYTNNNNEPPANYNNEIYNYDNFMFSLANFVKNNLSLILQDEFNKALYDYYFDFDVEDYDSIYEYDKENGQTFFELNEITDEQFIRAFYFVMGYICISEEGNPANNVDDSTFFLLRWNSSYALISKMQNFLKQYSDNKIAILMSSDYDFVENWGYERVGSFFMYGTNSPISNITYANYGISCTGAIEYMDIMIDNNGIRPSFKINL